MKISTDSFRFPCYYCSVCVWKAKKKNGKAQPAPNRKMNEREKNGTGFNCAKKKRRKIHLFLDGVFRINAAIFMAFQILYSWINFIWIECTQFETRAPVLYVCLCVCRSRCYVQTDFFIHLHYCFKPQCRIFSHSRSLHVLCANLWSAFSSEIRDLCTAQRSTAHGGINVLILIINFMISNPSNNWFDRYCIASTLATKRLVLPSGSLSGGWWLPERGKWVRIDLSPSAYRRFLFYIYRFVVVFILEKRIGEKGKKAIIKRNSVIQLRQLHFVHVSFIVSFFYLNCVVLCA